MTCYSLWAFIWYMFRFCALKTLGGVSRTKCRKKRPVRTDRQTDRQTNRKQYPRGSGNKNMFFPNIGQLTDPYLFRQQKSAYLYLFRNHQSAYLYLFRNHQAAYLYLVSSRACFSRISLSFLSSSAIFVSLSAMAFENKLSLSWRSL